MQKDSSDDAISAAVTPSGPKTPHSSSRPAGKRRRKSRRLRHLAGGLALLSVLGLAGGMNYTYQRNKERLKSLQSSMELMKQEYARLHQTLERTRQLAEEQKALVGQGDGSRLAALEQSVEALRQAVMAQTESRARAAGGGMSQEPGLLPEMSRKLQELGERLVLLDRRLNTEGKQVRERLQHQVEKVRHQSEQWLLYGRLHAAVLAGKPFGEELAALRATALPDEAQLAGDELNSFATHGVLSVAALRQQWQLLREAVNHVPVAAEEEEGWVAGTLANLDHVISIRRVEKQQDNLLQQAEEALLEEDLAQHIRILQAERFAGNEKVQEWITKVRHSMQAFQTLDQLRFALFSVSSDPLPLVSPSDFSGEKIVGEPDEPVEKPASFEAGVPEIFQSPASPALPAEEKKPAHNEEKNPGEEDL